MMKGLWELLTIFSLGRLFNLCKTIAKSHFLRFYLGVVEGLRGACLSLIFTLLLVLLGFFGFILIHVGFFWFLPIETDTKIIALSVLGVIYLFIPLVGTLILHSRARWLKMTGAEKWLNDVSCKDSD